MSHSSPCHGLLLFRCYCKSRSRLVRFPVLSSRRAFYVPPNCSVFYLRVLDKWLQDAPESPRWSVFLTFSTPGGPPLEGKQPKISASARHNFIDLLGTPHRRPRDLIDPAKKLALPGQTLLQIKLTRFRRTPQSALAKNASTATFKEFSETRKCNFELQKRGSWTERESVTAENDRGQFKLIVHGPILDLGGDVIKRPLPGNMDSRWWTFSSEAWGSSELMTDMVPLSARLMLSLNNLKELSHISTSQELCGSAFEIADELEPFNNIDSVALSLAGREFHSTFRSEGHGKIDRQRLVECKARSTHRAFIAFGSNMGNRFSMIETALKEMEILGVKVVRSSSLWETAPMYVTDQESFINGVCEIETIAQPAELLSLLQGIEISMGRVKVTEKGPRNIDLDILLYDDLVLTTEDLTIPHPRIRERDFVLFPLCELIPSERLPPPQPLSSFKHYLTQLPQDTRTQPIKTTPLSPSAPVVTPLTPSRPTHIMAILNLTPDSFSDGGIHQPHDLPAISSTVRTFIASGATIIDVGGQSTRPGANPLSEEDEIARVVPVIKTIRSLPEAANIAISIDTFRARVAEEAVNAGADIINDVSAGILDADMLPTAARLGKTIILMHMRGTPKTMREHTSYPSGVVTGVATELHQRVEAALAAGIRPWRIMLDPGFGFAKNKEQNLELMRRMRELRSFKGLKGYPWVVGTSRKNFIGKITGVETPSERTWGTAVTVADSIRAGADIVRVHDVPEMAQVVKMADALWRVEMGQPGRRGSWVDSLKTDGGNPKLSNGVWQEGPTIMKHLTITDAD